MKTKCTIASFALSIIVFWAFEDMNAISKIKMTSPTFFKAGEYSQDTPKLDSAKRHNKHSKKIKLNKDSIKRYKKDTVV